MKVIINADDCGNNETVNRHIRQCIEAGKVTSTTIMANQPAFQGAVQLYHDFHETVSFGVHLNLTQGPPLLHSKKLLQAGILTDEGGELRFCKARSMGYRFKHMPSDLRTELYRELRAQIDRVQQAGIRISHFDSHHDVHTGIPLLGIVPQLMRDYGICKLRPMTDFAPHAPFYYGKRTWALLTRLKTRRLVMPQDVIALGAYFATEYPRTRGMNAIELVIHPGHYMPSFQEEEQQMLAMTYPDDFQLISYNEL